ncbi:MAG: exosortase/archaeosortase family protein [Bacteroidales bacterium]|nr:exosortase/archaeosortase family protein [Bacteroidales bacterium]MCF8398706.1 exosortase/archaeosortase family protein [Bacteroidales bacterium]
MPNKKSKRKKQKDQEKISRREAYREFLHQFKPLLIAVALWFLTINLIHLPFIRDEVLHFFVGFILESSVAFGKMLFLPVSSPSFPYITVSGYTMEVIMECTAYNFYIFVIYLSLFSPVSWKQRIITLLIFLLAIFVINNLRFIVMGYVGKHNPQMFDYIHDYLWNIFFGFLVFLIWLWRYKPAMDARVRERSAQG